MLFMVVERFKDTSQVRNRFLESGRMMPEGLTYVDSWIDETFTVCYQIMECTDRVLLDQWISNWSDIVDFEVSMVRPSKLAWEAYNTPMSNSLTDTTAG